MADLRAKHPFLTNGSFTGIEHDGCLLFGSAFCAELQNNLTFLQQVHVT